jgi:phosphate starvation-inducible protein PhoH
MQQKISRKEKRRNKDTSGTEQNLSLRLNSIAPKTQNQNIAFKSYYNDKTLFLHGLPGTGKTFIALYLALKSVLEDKKQRRVVIVRSAVPTRDIGFMPGSASEKMKHYEAPYQNLCTELFGRGDAYEILKQKKIIEFLPTSFIRGLTIDDAVIIVDEAQNMSFPEIRSVITRVGQNSRLIISGDKEQDDLTSERFKEESGIQKLMKIMKRIDEVSFVEFGVDDILRSDFIKKFIMAEYGLLSREASSVSTLPSFITEAKTVRL